MNDLQTQLASLKAKEMQMVQEKADLVDNLSEAVVSLNEAGLAVPEAPPPHANARLLAFVLRGRAWGGRTRRVSWIVPRRAAKRHVDQPPD